MSKSPNEQRRERTMKRVVRDIEIEMRRLVQLLVRDTKAKKDTVLAND